MYLTQIKPCAEKNKIKMNALWRETVFVRGVAWEINIGIMCRLEEDGRKGSEQDSRLMDG